MKRMLFIPAAGLGSRLGALTQETPKALVAYRDLPLIEWVMCKAEAAGFTEAVVNVHHHADRLEAYLRERVAAVVSGGGRPLHSLVSDERALLMNTGGALTHALPFLDGCDYVLVHNTDVFSNLDMNRLCADFEAAGADAMLVLQDRETDRRLAVSADDGRIYGWYNRKTGAWKPGAGAPAAFDAATMRTYAYNGIHILKTDVIRTWAGLYGKVPFGLIEAYLRTADRHPVKAYFPPEPFLWRDMGKPEAFEKPLGFEPLS
ncbi:MAG: NTP transferase domain-containing protein [Bacteroidales bacterium]|nr:NTP transferase domain-containing protein [Bacteroidales bacterium]